MSMRGRLVLAGGVAITSLMILGFGEPLARAKCMLGASCEVVSVQTGADGQITLASLGGNQDLGAIRTGEPPELIVLPFRLLSGRAKDIDLADEMTDELIVALSRAPELQVVSSNTSFGYSHAVGHQADEVASELGVRYALQVWVQQGAGKFRANMKLFDAEQGSTVLDEQIEMGSEEFGELSEIILRKVAQSLDLSMEITAMPRRERSPDRGMGWLPSANQAWATLRQEPNAPDAIATARRWIEDALHIDPENALAWAGLSYAELRLNALGQGEGAGSVAVALDAARRAVNLDPQNPRTHFALGYALREAGDVAGSRAEMQTCLDLNPNNASCLQGLAQAEILSGQPAAALPLMKSAMRLSPREPLAAEWHSTLGLAHAMVGDYGQAEEQARKAIRRDRTFAPGHELLTASLAALGRDAEAHQARRAYLSFVPMKSFASARLRYEALSSDQAYRGQLQPYLANLARAGVGTPAELLLTRTARRG